MTKGDAFERLARRFDLIIDTVERINEAYERVLRSDVRYRFAIDMASLRSR